MVNIGGNFNIMIGKYIHNINNTISQQLSKILNKNE